MLSAALISALVQLAAPGAVEGKSFIWQIKGGSNTSYLVGSIHMAKKELYPLPSVMERSFASSKVLVVEARVDEVSKLLPMVMQQAMYRPPDSLDKHISAKTMAKLKARLKVLGLPAAAMVQLKPWVIAMTLSALEMKKMGFETASGIDMHFLRKAGSRAMTIAELEGAEFQLKLFSGLSDKEQEEFLLYTLSQSKRFRTYIKKIVRFWKRGDGANLYKLISLSSRKSAGVRKIYKKLITDRNVRMADRIVKMLKGDAPHFIVVGAGHVTGPKGLVRLLRAKGYALKQL
jgi:uncharacterized protein YbaP (TraB family)